VASECATLFRLLTSRHHKSTYTKKVKIRQYVDDDNSLPGLFEVLGQYEAASGAHKTHLKQMGYLLVH